MWHQAPNEMQRHLQAPLGPHSQEAFKHTALLYLITASNTGRGQPLRDFYTPQRGVAVPD